MCVCVWVGGWVDGGGCRWGLLTELELSFHTGEFISLDLPVSLSFLHTQPRCPPPPAALFMLWCRSEPERGTAKNKVRCDSCVNEHTRLFVWFPHPPPHPLCSFFLHPLIRQRLSGSLQRVCFCYCWVIRCSEAEQMRTKTGRKDGLGADLGSVSRLGIQRSELQPQLQLTTQTCRLKFKTHMSSVF